MDLHLKWHQPLSLTDDSANNGVYAVNLDPIPSTPGIYIFLRVHGATAECLYVGKANKLKERVKTQLNNSKLMQGIKNADAGKRRLLFGEFVPKKGQQQKNLLTIERTLIRHYLSIGDQLLNIKGTGLVKNSVSSERPVLKKFIPRVIYFEK
ncbi:MAG: hypothetical protein BWK74_04680 [Desulfobacteraceae bacterium A6]|nr:MAG: hypothetical protein BWK74_04680 [Desulfobacteraceae bacterium A6]